MRKYLFSTLLSFMTLAFSVVGHAAPVIESLPLVQGTTSAGHSVLLGRGFYDSASMDASDPVIQLLSAAPTSAPSQYYIGHAQYRVSIDSANLTTAFFEDMRIFSYLVGPSNKLQLQSQNPFRIRCQKSILLGAIQIVSFETVQTFEGSELQNNPKLNGLIRQLSNRPDRPARVIVQTFDHFNDYFDSGTMLTLIYKEGSNTYVDLITISIVKDIPALFGKGAVESSSEQDLHYYVDRLWDMRRSFKTTP